MKNNIQHGYYNNGSLKNRDDVVLNNGMYDYKIEDFGYNSRNLVNKFCFYKAEAPFPDCEFSLPYGNRKEWIYKYNPFNERESKRMNYSPAGDNGGGIYPWVYYQLGSNKEQFAVYHGIQISDPLMIDVNFGLHSNNANPSRVYFYPAEYNTYGSSSSPLMTFKFDENSSQWMKNIKIYDHIGNVRAVVRDEGTGNYSIISQMDYEPFGAVLSQIGESERQSFIGKEKDYESSLGDFGVRKYDDFAGRFFQIDPLWEKYYGWTPYQYSANNPVSFLDPGGEIVVAAAPAVGYGGAVVAVAIATWCVAEIQTPGSTAGFADAFAKAVDEAIADISGAMARASITDATEQSIYHTTFASDATAVGTSVMLAQSIEQLEKQNQKNSKKPDRMGHNDEENKQLIGLLAIKMAREGYKLTKPLRDKFHNFIKPHKVGKNVPKEIQDDVIEEFLDYFVK
jgi:RHS repeat-associated protein